MLQGQHTRQLGFTGTSVFSQHSVGKVQGRIKGKLAQGISQVIAEVRSAIQLDT